MKNTEYFVSIQRHHDQLSLAVSDVKQLKKEFIEKNILLIEEIDSEEITFVVSGGNNNVVYAVIKLTYFSNNK